MSAGVEFTETMSGFWTPGATDFQAGHDAGREASEALEFTLTISVEDLDRFIADPAHAASARGEVRGPYFGGAAKVAQGTFNLFKANPEGVREMRYDLEFEPTGATRFRLSGFKTLRDDAGPDLWRDTTTLMTEVQALPGGAALGRGVLHISPAQFLRQLQSFRAVGTQGPVEAVQALTRFGRFFLGGLWDIYGKDLLGR